MWYSTIYANPTLPASSSNILLPTSCIVRNLAFDSNARSGGPGDGNGGGLNVKGNNWVVDGVWGAASGRGRVWANGSHGIVMNFRTSCTCGRRDKPQQRQRRGEQQHRQFSDHLQLLRARLGR